MSGGQRAALSGWRGTAAAAAASSSRGSQLPASAPHAAAHMPQQVLRRGRPLDVLLTGAASVPAGGQVPTLKQAST